MARRERIDTAARKRSVPRDERGRFVRDKRKATITPAISVGNRPMLMAAVLVAGLIVATAGALMTAAPLKRRSASHRL